MKKILFLVSIISMAFSLTACGRNDKANTEEVPPVTVKGQTVAESRSIKRMIDYPGLVAAESEATIAAKTSGNLTALNFKVGDRVSLGQELARIDDVNSPNFNAKNFNTSQIKQAKIAADSAQAGYNLARDSYNNLLVSSVKDLKAAEISRDQADKGQANLDVTTAQSLKSAQLAYETAKIATEQARLTLVNQQKQVAQNSQSATDNANIAADSAAATVGSLLTGINNIAGLDSNQNVSLPYANTLGVLDSSSLTSAQASYAIARDAYNNYKKQKFPSTSDKVQAAASLANVAKQMVDDAKVLFDKTVPSSALPQTSSLGASLSGLQATVAGYQTQITAAISQVTSAGQMLISAGLNSQSLIDSLNQAYSLAQQQEASAAQNLANLQAGNTSQKDQAGFAANLAQNQYDNLKVKIESQVAAARTQMETAQLQYNNALVALQNLYDAHSVIAPLDGTITKIFLSSGQAVSPGQPVITVSQTDNVKVQFYIEPESLAEIKPGLPLTVKDGSGREYNGIVAAVSPQADPVTRRFLAEAKLEKSDNLYLGTVVNVIVSLVKTAPVPGTIILPLSAVTIGQNGNFIFIYEQGKAKLVPVEIQEVVGEMIKLKVDLPGEAIIITDGNKLISDGQALIFSQ